MLRNKKLVFIVDDDPMHTQMLKDHLDSTFDFDLRTFFTGEECVDQLDHHPQIIVLDYFLNTVDPGARNGIEILKFIKKEYPEIKVVMLSGQDKIDIAVETMKYGAFDYVVKNESGFVRTEQAINRIFDHERLQGRVTYYRSLSMVMVVVTLAIIILTVILSLSGII